MNELKHVMWDFVSHSPDYTQHPVQSSDAASHSSAALYSSWHQASQGPAGGAGVVVVVVVLRVRGSARPPPVCRPKICRDSPIKSNQLSKLPCCCPENHTEALSNPNSTNENRNYPTTEEGGGGRHTAPNLQLQPQTRHHTRGEGAGASLPEGSGHHANPHSNTHPM